MQATALFGLLASVLAHTALSACNAPLLIDDWESQSRLTFLFYNAMLQPSSDDGSFQSIVVGSPAANRVTLTPRDPSSYFYSEVGCVEAKDVYGGISLRIQDPRDTSFTVELQSSSSCNSGDTINIDQTTADLGWRFDGSEQLYTIPFSKFPGLDTSHIATILMTSFTSPVVFGPMAFYCGDSATEYVPPTPTFVPDPSSTVAAPPRTGSVLVVDRFAATDSNALGFWHGADDGMTLTWGAGELTVQSTDPDFSFYTQLSGSCSDMTPYKDSYLHLVYSGTTAFTIALQQHNAACNEAALPFPDTWDSLEAARYAHGQDIYIPFSHFNIDLVRTVGLALKGFYTNEPLTLTTIEIVPSVPSGVTVPNKLASGDLVFACTRPNSFASAIDDGDPQYAQQVLNIIKEENIKVTFFTVGAPLLDRSTNLSNVYNEMASAGHQIALHSFTHPKMEGLPDEESID